MRTRLGKLVRINVTNRLPETTGVHMHGIEFDDWRFNLRSSNTEPLIRDLEPVLVDLQPTLASLRRHIGIVFQFFNLLEGMSALENVTLPAIIAGSSRKQAETRARDLLDLLGLADKARSAPGVRL